MNYGGFWIRFVAKFIDGIILGVATMLIYMVGLMPMIMGGAGTISDQMMLIQFMLQIVAFAMGLGYSVFFVGRFGATPGKMIWGLKIVMADGAGVTYGRAVGRFFAEYLSSLLLGIGYLMAAFDGQKRTLHDRICDTRVIKSR